MPHVLFRNCKVSLTFASMNAEASGAMETPKKMPGVSSGTMPTSVKASFVASSHSVESGESE